MSRTQNLRWKRKALVVGALAVSFAGLAALSYNTVSASNYGEWDCSGSDPLAAVSGSNDEPCAAPEEAPDNASDAAPAPTAAVPDSVPTTDPATTAPYVTQPIPTEAPPAPGVPSVSGSAVCGSGTGTINLTLGNSGDMPITFVVTHPVSGVSTTIMVEAGTSQQLTLLGTTVGTVNVAITAGGMDMSRSFQINSSCAAQAPAAQEPPVVAVSPQVVVAKTKALPVTGRGSALPTLYIALGLFGAGSVALAFARRNSSTRNNKF